MILNFKCTNIFACVKRCVSLLIIHCDVAWYNVEYWPRHSFDLCNNRSRVVFNSSSLWNCLNQCYLTDFSWNFLICQFSQKRSLPALPLRTTVLFRILCWIYVLFFSFSTFMTVIHYLAGVWLYVRQLIIFFYNAYLTFLIKTVCN